MTPPNESGAAPTEPGAIPTVGENEAAELIAQAHSLADAQESEEAPLSEEALERLKTIEKKERTVLPPTPLEQAMEPSIPTPRSETVDAAWLTNYPDVNVKSCLPTETDKTRYGVALGLDEPYTDEQRMWDGKLNITVRMLTGEVIDELYEYLKPFRDNREKDPFKFADQLQHAGAAVQVLKIGDRSLSPCNTRSEIEARVKEFKKLQGPRWTAVLLAVRQANLKGRMLAEMIVNFDADFSKPDASA